MAASIAEASVASGVGKRSISSRICTALGHWPAGPHPLAAANGRAEIDGLIGAVQQQFPDFVFTLGGPVDAHHEQARFSWHLGPEGAAEPVVIGFDVAVLNGGGQIRSVYGFLDKVPAA